MLDISPKNSGERKTNHSFFDYSSESEMNELVEISGKWT